MTGKNKDSMLKFGHRVLAEDSIADFIKWMEEKAETEISQVTKDWIYARGNELFDKYYIADSIKVHLVDEQELEDLRRYMDEVQTSLGRMFGHILLLELGIYLDKRIK